MQPHSAPHVKDYDRLARLFDQRLGLYARQTIEQALALARLEGTEAVLDACSGTGELLQLIALQGHRGPVFGADFSETMVHAAEHRLRAYPNITIRHERIEAMTLPSDSFHVIFNTNVLHYLEHPQEIFTEFYRLLRPHGRLIVADLAANSVWMRLWSTLRRFIRPTYQHLYQIEEAQRLLEEAGFTIVSRRLFKVTGVWSVMLLEAQRPAPHLRRIQEEL
ncbi:class I SAM-dependent methyltransferase [Candidatus Berkelbacteria bacterium]|nr:class I SAM-dependent methyltransferase [Candidatus Berkelbacteria bacterium]